MTNWRAYMYPPVIVVDWDDTCVGPTDQWLPGAVEALEHMALSVEVLIFSAGVTNILRYRAIRQQLDKAGLQHVEVRGPQAQGKPHGCAFIDDRAVHFNGDWPASQARAEEMVDAYRRFHGRG